MSAVPGDPLAHFDGMYERTDDPWEMRSSWYERRKREVLLASLPAERYGTAWEPGCSNGHLTVELARRCERLVASDISPRAAVLARAAVAGLDHVRVDVARVPDESPPLEPGSCGLVVLSELTFYLPDEARARTVRIALELLEPGGHLVVAHWRGHPEDASLHGEAANAEVVAVAPRHLIHHLDERFVLDVVAV